MKKSLTILSAALALTFLASTANAAVLVDMGFENISGDTVPNAGTIGNGTLQGIGGRPKPTVVQPGLPPSLDALHYTGTQTGPDNRQCVLIESDGMDNLVEFTIKLWFKSHGPNPTGSDPTWYPTLNTILSNCRSDSSESSPGIFLSLNKDGDGNPQPYIKMGDGTNGDSTYYGSGGWGLYDGNWHFIAVTYRTGAAYRCRFYDGDITNAVSQYGSVENFNNLTSIGNATNLITIGDGLGNWSNRGALTGTIDKVYVTDTMLSLSELESLRQADLIPEPAAFAVFGVASLALFRRR